MLNKIDNFNKNSYGRVLTLVPSSGKKVYGLAYKIRTSNLSETFEKLNLREKCGYSLRKVSFYQEDADEAEALNCVCYFANDDNFYYSREPDMNKMAEQIHKSIGPSGTNKEYLDNACSALRQLANNNEGCLKLDSHLFELNSLVKKLDGN